MNLWLTHFGAIFVPSGVLLVWSAAMTRWDPPLWVFLVWVVGSIVVSVPVHRWLKRVEARTLRTRLESANPGSQALTVEIAFSDWVALLSAVVPQRGSSLGQRYKFGTVAGRSRDHLAALVTDEALQFWSGPPSHPHLLTTSAWSEVWVEPSTGQVVIQRTDGGSVSLRLVTGPPTDGPRVSAPLVRAVNLAQSAQLASGTTIED